MGVSPLFDGWAWLLSHSFYQCKRFYPRTSIWTSAMQHVHSLKDEGGVAKIRYEYWTVRFGMLCYIDWLICRFLGKVGLRCIGFCAPGYCRR